MRRRDERGQMVAVETAIILPVLLLIVGLLIVLAGLQLTQLSVTSAASQAARAASLERDSVAATASAKRVAVASLAESGVDCLSSHVSVDAAGLAAPIGVPSSVSVTVHCDAAFGVGLPGFPTSRLVMATKSSPVDTYRSR